MWQEIIVGLCVLAAMAFVTRRLWRRQSAGCGTGACRGCSSTGNCHPKDKISL